MKRKTGKTYKTRYAPITHLAERDAKVQQLLTALDTPKAGAPTISLRRLRALLRYNDLTGELEWTSAARKKHTPPITTPFKSKGHATVALLGTVYDKARLVIYIITGIWESGTLTFRDGNPSNTHLDNILIQDRTSRTKPGAHFDPSNRRWVAVATLAGMTVPLPNTYETELDALDAIAFVEHPDIHLTHDLPSVDQWHDDVVYYVLNRKGFFFLYQQNPLGPYASLHKALQEKTRLETHAAKLEPVPKDQRDEIAPGSVPGAEDLFEDPANRLPLNRVPAKPISR